MTALPTVQEGDTPEYVANAGNSCFYCKTELYSTLQAVADELMGESPESEVRAGPVAAAPNPAGLRVAGFQVVMFNGTNADDRQDPTRLGLVAAVSEAPVVHRRPPS
jgi:PP-loop superfamily ATP-utilizing enzyme